MIIANGTIEIKQKTEAGGIDPVTGFPRRSDASWGEPVACQYVPVKQNLLAKMNGEPATIASYDVFIEERYFGAEQVRLKDLRGNVIGEFSIIEVEPLTAVCEIRLRI